MPNLLSWEEFPEVVKLRYSDGSILIVDRERFNRSFGVIVSCTFDEVCRDFAKVVIL